MQRAENARALQLVELTERVKKFNHELKKIDPYVEVFKAPENASHPGVRGGFWHILRRPPAGLPTFIVHETPDGQFRDLDSGIFQTLRDGDMWSAERQRDRAKFMRQAEQARERAEEQERAERVEELTDRMKAAWSPGVSFAGAGRGWSYRAGARKG